MPAVMRKMTEKDFEEELNRLRITEQEVGAAFAKGPADNETAAEYNARLDALKAQASEYNFVLRLAYRFGKIAEGEDSKIHLRPLLPTEPRSTYLEDGKENGDASLGSEVQPHQ